MWRRLRDNRGDRGGRAIGALGGSVRTLAFATTDIGVVSPGAVAVDGEFLVVRVVLVIAHFGGGVCCLVGVVGEGWGGGKFVRHWSDV